MKEKENKFLNKRKNKVQIGGILLFVGAVTTLIAFININGLSQAQRRLGMGGDSYVAIVIGILLLTIGIVILRTLPKEESADVPNYNTDLRLQQEQMQAQIQQQQQIIQQQQQILQQQQSQIPPNQVE